MEKIKNTIHLSQNELNEMINLTVKQLVSEGVFDNLKGAWQRFANGYETKEGNPQSIEDVFEGDGWKIVTKVPKNSSTYYFVSRKTGAMGAFYGVEIDDMVEELNTFLGGNRVKYIGHHPEKKYLEVFRIS